MNMDSNLNNERRKREQRRHVDLGPPSGIGERRINIERRLFNLDFNSGEQWLSHPQQCAAGKGTTSH